ncbi:hypothetical protein PACTADRAFT_49320 [Pachysolen tannophilus NRRL Y-2460]|uniref:DNA-directed RNA polymerase III subunit RPC6 n=1 Tax=Pachysolen tannophilus NRRL Y-2460 TaxID=669874 RepID=A0A1E4TVV6_PACTA|nr:hypothetical protein PACTADRAFT_49320 [Pachysolen tannophilus NRRL Y-2460]
MSSSISTRAEKLHGLMLEQKSGSIFDQKELQILAKIANPEDLMILAQELINKQLLKLVKQDGVLKFQAVKASEAEKVQKMSKDEAMIYSYIEASGREGIWTKTIKAKTNLHQHVVLRCLKGLENQSYIKSVKSVKYPTRKIYMLYHLTPSIEVTGGPWFTDSELDTEFIDSLLLVVWRYVASKSYPNAFNKNPEYNAMEKSQPPQQSFPHTYVDYPTAKDIMEFISNSGIANVELSQNDIRALCNVLVYDEKLEKLHNGFIDSYKASWQSILENGGGLENDVGQEEDSPFDLFDSYKIITPGYNENESEIPSDIKDGAIYLDSWMNG